MRCLLLVLLFTSFVQAREMPVLAGVVNGFAVDAYQKVDKEGNFCYSPFALHGVLAMVETGSEKRTRAELYGALKLLGERGDAMLQHANLYDDMVFRYTRDLPEQVKGKEEPLDVFLLNRIYLQQGRQYEGEFMDIGKEVAGYGMELKDFQAQPELIRQSANGWVAHETFQRVKDALPNGAVNEETDMLLVNGLFLKAPWHVPFDSSLTKRETFYLLSGEKAQVAMMRKEDKCGYLASGAWTAVSMPFGQYSECQLVLLVPKSKGGLPEVERLLASKDLMDMRELPQRTVRLVMPPFEIKGGSTDFRAALMELEVKRAFDVPAGSAEFGKVSTTGGVSLDSVYQMSYIKLDELGLDVQKATKAVLLERVHERPSRGIELRVDRPFLFFVQDTRTGLVLMMGRVLDPAKK